jgi:hypothetical protein
MVCVAHHEGGREEKCRLIVLDQLMEAILPADCLTMLQNLRELCSNQAISNVLNRNQRRRAVLSFQISEQFYERLAKDKDDSKLQNPPREFEMLPRTPAALAEKLLKNMANVTHCVCSGCLSQESELFVANWCLDCEDQSVLCYCCFKQNPSEQPLLGPSCGACTGNCSTAFGNHTRVTFVKREFFISRRIGQSFKALREDIDSICSRYPAAQAIAIMKEWYAKDPIDPDLSFEDVVRSTRAASPLPPPDQPRESGRVTEEVFKERGGKSNRAWSSLKRFVRRR